MSLRLPALPQPLPWTPTQWRSLRSADLIESPLFIRYCAQWAGKNTRLDKSILAELRARAQAKRLDLPSVPAIQSAVHAWVTVVGGRRRAPELVFFIHQALLRPYCELLLTPGITPAERIALAGHVRRAGSTVQQAALIAISQRLRCAPAGLQDWKR